MSLPARPDRGQSISADSIARLIDETRARTVAGHGGGLVQQRGGGTVIARRPTGLQPAPRSLFLYLHPFKVVDASGGGTAKVTVIFGQVNSITPTIGGTALDDATPPELTVTTSGVVYLDATVNGSGIATSAVIANAASVPSGTSTHAYITLATVTISGGAITAISQSVTHSLGHQMCGPTTHNFWGV